MSKPACKCKKAAECEECPEWIFTFADLVMLMMGFFVILWVLKPTPGKQGSDQTPQTQDQASNGKWLETVGDIRAGFGWVPDPSSKDPVDVHWLQKKDHPRSAGKQSGKGGDTTEPKRGAEGTDPHVTSVRPGQHVTYGGKLLFDAGEARLTPETSRTLDDIFQGIKGHLNIILVKGHASLDDLPDLGGVSRQARSQQQMDLSLRRAQAAANYLINLGLSPDVVRVQGCSTYEPLVQKAYGPEALLTNRRVEIEVTDVLVPERQDRAAPTMVPALPARPPTTSPTRPE